MSLNEHLFSRSGVPDELRHLINHIALAAKYIQYAIRTTEAGLAGSKNQFGEEQQKLDVLSDDIIRQHLCESRLVAGYVSEEVDDLVELDEDGTYLIAFDPLDGSSLVDANFAIGSIFGIYEGDKLIGRTPREQVAALYVLYGPRTVLVYSTGRGVHSFLLNDVGEFIVLKENMTMKEEAKYYAPGNLRAVNDNASYRALLDAWLDEEVTLRYSGCMVADIHHILCKGNGVFTNVGGSAYPEGKLKLVFECGPFAYLVEQAGGSASDGKDAVLDRTIKSYDQRSPIIIGSKKEVERSCEVLKKKA
jgi:fructose-1,6-bisphosphatase I